MQTETNFNIDSAEGLTTYLKTVGSPIKIQNKEAEVILKTLSEHQVELHTDSDGKLYQKLSGRASEETTVDDVVDLTCEYNYEDSYMAGRSVETTPDFVIKCRAKKKLEELDERGQILNRIFYQTKYGRKVHLVADRICSELFTKFNLVPIYDVPFYEDKMVSEPAAYHVGRTSGGGVQTVEGGQEESLQADKDTDVSFENTDVSEVSREQSTDNVIVSADSPAYTDEDDKEPEERTKGAR